MHHRHVLCTNLCCAVTAILCFRYGMLDPSNKDKDDLPLTIRAVFIIGPDKKLKLSLNYPASVGRNMDEILRCVDALQLSAKHSVATPANWPYNHDSIGKKGWAFLLPTVTPEDAKLHFPDHHSCAVSLLCKLHCQVHLLVCVPPMCERQLLSRAVNHSGLCHTKIF